jgi:hypothetical protein
MLFTYVLVFLVVSFPLTFPPLCSPLLQLCYMPHPFHPPWLHHSKYTRQEYKSCSPLLCSFFHPSITSSLFGLNVLLSMLFSNTLNLCSSFNVRDNVSCT